MACSHIAYVVSGEAIHVRGKGTGGQAVILEVSDGGVGLETVCKMACSFIINAIVVETAGVSSEFGDWNK